MLLFDDDQSDRRTAHPDRPASPLGRQRGAIRVPRLEVTALFIATMLVIGVVVGALNMKFEADQARWQQRQTCLDWYALQANYGVGPWFVKLPAAAVDCGGGTTDDGTPTVPGGSAPALLQSDLPPSAKATPAAEPSGG